jgi:hypothetical protein
MGSYIHAAQKHICDIVTRVAVSECADVRFALVSYRDHPPQDETYVTRVFPFTAAVEEMQQYVGTMSAQGGGDGPEAVTAALDDALRLPWRPNATKVAVLIADAPPHGLEPTGDGFPNGDPEGRDPLEIARQMAAGGITVYSVGCEPALGSYRFARDFMCSLAEITGGQAVALSSADKLAEVIINGSAEEISLTRLTREVEEEVERVRVTSASAHEPFDEDAVQMQAWQNLHSRGVMSKQMRHDGAMKQKNASVWKSASSLSAAKMELSKTVEAPGADGFDYPLFEPMSASLLAYRGEEEAVRSASFSKPSACTVSTASFSKPSRVARGLSWMMSPFMKESKPAPCPPEADARMKKRSVRGSLRTAEARMASPPPVLRAAMPMAADCGGIMSKSAPEEATSVKSNVLVEEGISYDQVKRIMARKSAR